MAASKAEWQTRFGARIKTKAHEQFNLLLCDLVTAEPEQLALLERLLFDEDGHACANHWNSYVQYAAVKFAERKSQLQRLINKALELLPEDSNRDSRDYLMLHVASAKLKRCDPSFTFNAPVHSFTHFPCLSPPHPISQ